MLQAEAEASCVDAWDRMEVAALAGAEGAIQDARLQILATAMVVAATPLRQIQDPDVKCASRKGTWLASAGTVLMAPTFQKKGMQEQSSLLKLMIQAGSWTPVLLTT
jgi:hypothetical protein